MTHEVSCNGRKVSLTRLEFDLLLMLASHEGQIFSKEELFRAVWGQNCDDTLKVVANTVSNLRKKLTDCGSFIRTTHGGYTFRGKKENDPE
jgi:DNA-binding response OmpR family regulator